MKIVNLSYDVNEDVIEKFETSRAIRLPSSFRKFLLQNNACFVKPNGFYIKHVKQIQEGEEPNDSLAYFLGFADKTDEEYTLDWALSIYKDRIPSWCLPIAFDFAGNVVCLGLSGDCLGKVYFWTHEGETETEENLFCLADDFNSFVDSLSYGG